MKLTVEQVAEEMGVSKNTVRNWIRDGRLKAIQPFKKAKISIETDELEKFKKGNRHE